MCQRFAFPRLLVVGLSILPGVARAGDDPPVVRVSQPVWREVADFEIFSGRLAAAATVDVRPHVGGTLRKVLFKEGGEVNKGDVLFEIDPAPYQAAVNKAEADTALAEARRKRTEADFQRAQQLLTRRAMSREDYDKSASDRAEAEAALRVARAQFDQAKTLLQLTKVVAPIPGRAGRALIDVGNLVRGGESGPVLVTLVSTDPIFVYFEMHERSWLRYQKLLRQEKANEVRTPIAVGLAGEQGFPHRGVCDFLDNRADPKTGSLNARGVFPNPDGILTAGLFARVRMQIGKPYKALQVSGSVVMGESPSPPEKLYVLVVNAKNVVEKRPVQMGTPRDDGMRTAEKGLRPEDWVIVGGADEVQPGDTVEPRRVAMPAAEKEQRP